MTAEMEQHLCIPTVQLPSAARQVVTTYYPIVYFSFNFPKLRESRGYRDPSRYRRTELLVCMALF